MKVQLYGNKIPLWKSNKMWRESRAKHIKRDLQQTKAMTDSIFGGQFKATYDRNAMLLKAAAQRAVKKA